MIKRFLNNKFINYTLLGIIVFIALITVYPPLSNALNFSVFTLQILIVYFFAGLLFLIINQSRLMFVTFGCCALISIFLKERSTQNTPALPDKSETEIQLELKVANFNLTEIEEDKASVYQIINSCGADFISIQNISGYEMEG